MLADVVVDVLVRGLGSIVGPEHVLTDPSMTAGFGTDWTRRWSAQPLAVVRPADTVEVAAVLAFCRDAGVPVIPQGGNTGLVGGGVPRNDREAVVVSTTRLQRLDAIDEISHTVVVGAGVTVAQLDDHARRSGLRYAIDLAARDTATIGGTVATNAGGLRVVGLGETRRQVAGIEAVIANGGVIDRLAPLAKDNGGYDLAQLMTGSEGTLGIITAVRVRLIPQPAIKPSVILIGMPSVSAAVDLMTRVRTERFVTGAELFRTEGMELVKQAANLPHPLERQHPVYLLLETDELPDLDESLDAVVDDRMWEYRDRQAEVVAAQGVPHKLDVCLPVPAVAQFIDELPMLMPIDSVLHIYAHIGDGNLHINVLNVPDNQAHAMDDAVLKLVVQHGGSISAEHGVGVAKREWLHLSRNPTELASMRGIKDALDPDGIMNPGVLLP